jgi:hypothetical protein
MRRGIVYVLGVVLLATGAFAQSYVPRGGGGAATCTSGDVKSAVLSSDHDKWVLLNGRAKSALTGAQQTTATALGIGANLPSGAGRTLVGGTLLANLGSATIAQNQLPNVNLSHNHGVGVGIGGSSDVFLNGSSGNPRGAVTDAANVYLNGGVTQQPFTPLAIGVNHFICI